MAQGIAGIPVGTMLTQALKGEAALLPDAGLALVKGGATGTSVTKTGVAPGVLAFVASKASSFFAGTAASAAVATLIMTALWAGGAFEEAQPVNTQGEIVFVGGDSVMHTVNPSFASAWALNERGDLKVSHWWITKTGSTEILLSGEGSRASGIKTHMQELQGRGKYTLWFAIEDSAGSSYTLHREFTITTDGS